MARRTVLEQLGYSIVEAHTGAEALEEFDKQHFDLVVTDYKMPKMDGLELIQNLRLKKPAVPVILLSGFAEALGLTEASTRADVVIQKSNNEVNHLVRSVSHLLLRKAPKKAASGRAKARKTQA